MMGFFNVTQPTFDHLSTLGARALHRRWNFHKLLVGRDGALAGVSGRVTLSCTWKDNRFQNRVYFSCFDRSLNQPSWRLAS